MFGRRLHLFTLLGFKVRLHWSWLILATLVVWSLARGIFPASIEGLPASAYWWMGAIGAVGLFLSIVLHELGHSIVARAYGIQMGGITLFIFGGVAEMGNEPPSPKSELLMAIAGPITSVGVAGICAGLQRLNDLLGWPVQATVILEYLSWINLLLAVFNMVPAFPLDGGRVLRSILWAVRKNLAWATRVASFIGIGFAFVLMTAGVVSVFWGNFVGGIWWVVLGLFVRRASQVSYQQVVLRQVLSGEPVRRFMNDNPITVPPGLTLKDLVENYVYRYHFKMFPVVEDGHLLGCVTLNQLKGIPREEWALHTAQNIAVPCTAENSIAPDTDAVNALSIMNRKQLSRLLVVDQGRLAGVLALKDLLNFLSRKMELEGAG